MRAADPDLSIIVRGDADHSLPSGPCRAGRLPAGQCLGGKSGNRAPPRSHDDATPIQTIIPVPCHQPHHQPPAAASSKRGCCCRWRSSGRHRHVGLDGGARRFDWVAPETGCRESASRAAATTAPGSRRNRNRRRRKRNCPCSPTQFYPQPQLPRRRKPRRSLHCHLSPRRRCLGSFPGTGGPAFIRL